MSSRRVVVYEIEFTTADGVRVEYGERGLRILNVRQLGEAQRHAALELIERAEEVAERAPVEPLDRAPLVTRAEFLMRELGWRITHRRTKQEEPPLR